MRKRLGLLILGLLLCSGAFLLYQYVTDASILAPRKAESGDKVVGPVDHSQTYEFRDRSTGALKYEIRAKSADPILDDQGHALPGEFKLIEPVATFYQKDGRTLELHADTCRTVVDQVPKHGGSDADAPPFQPRVATLSGNVRMSLSAKPPGPGAAKFQDTWITITFDGDVNILPNQNLLTSPGKVHVRSNVVEFDGGGLNLSYKYDRDDPKKNILVEVLRFDEGDTIIVRNVGKQALGFDAAEAATQTAPSASGAGTQMASTMPAPVSPGATTVASAPKDTTYKLSFGKNVSATVGGRSLTTDRLYALFVASTSAAKAETNSPEISPASTSTTPLPVPSGVAATNRAPAGDAMASTRAAPAPIAPPGPDDLVIHWTGAMEMRPSGPEDLVLSGAKDFALQAVGLPENPVHISDGAKWLTAGAFWYHRAEDRVEIESGELPAVTLADPALATVVCKGLSLLRTQRILKLAGPGTVLVPQSALHRDVAGRGAAAGAPLRLAFRTDATIDLENITDAKNPRKTVQSIRRAVLNGDVAFQDIGAKLNSDSLDILVAHRSDDKASQALEHLLASGHVHVKTARSGASLEDQPEGLDADRLELNSELRPGRTQPTLAQALVTGNVLAWNYSEQKAQDATLGAAPDKNAADKRLVRQAIRTPRLQAVLEPRERAGNTAATDPLALGGGTSVKSLLASEGVTIELDGFQGSEGKPVVVTGQTLTIEDPKSGHAVLEGDTGLAQANGVAKPVLVTMGEDQVTAGKLLIDQKAHTIEIPGTGTMVFVVRSKNPAEPPTRLQVDWSKNMTYDDRTRLASFYGLVTTQRLGRANETSTMRCHQVLQVQLADRTLKGSESPAGSRKSNIAALLARGDVEAEDRQLDIDGTPLTHVYLHTAEVRYTDATEFLEIPCPGTLLVEDFHPEKTSAKSDNKTPSARGSTGFSWEEKLTFDGKAGLLTMSRNVVMGHQPLKPFRMPGEKPGSVEPISKVTLRGDVLTAHMVSTNSPGGGTVSSPIALGSGGDVKLATAKAQGNARLDLGANELSGYALEFDDLKKTATATSQGDAEEVYLDRPNQALVIARQVIWDMTRADQGAFSVEGGRATYQAN